MSSDETHEVLGVNCCRRCCAGFDVSSYIGGSRMRLFSGLKSIVSLTYATVLLIIVLNYNVINIILQEMEALEENLEATATVITNNSSLFAQEINNSSVLSYSKERDQVRRTV